LFTQDDGDEVRWVQRTGKEEGGGRKTKEKKDYSQYERGTVKGRAYS